ncbi:MAG TPA: PIN domain-containing protein [Candidatus Eisenbacteria bacterium]|nr:PIN domain-containing protein [Candidatus Eisenbacteria bacterium]
MRYLLDSTFIIDYLRGLAGARDRLARMFEDGDEPLVNEVVVCEAWVGAREPDPALEALLRPIEFIQPGTDAARRAGRWRADARAKGLTLSLADALVAAAADDADAAVLTRNVRDFGLTPVRVESY